MKIGMVGLGRMGTGLAERLRRGAYEVVGYDRDPATRDVDSLAAVVGALPAPPGRLGDGAGRRHDRADPERARRPTRRRRRRRGRRKPATSAIPSGALTNLSARGIEFLDAGTSGGIWGLEVGFCLMIGGSAAAFATVRHAGAGRRLRARRSGWFGALYEDGPQRDRVRDDAGIRRKASTC